MKTIHEIFLVHYYSLYSSFNPRFILHREKHINDVKDYSSYLREDKRQAKNYTKIDVSREEKEIKEKDMLAKRNFEILQKDHYQLRKEGLTQSDQIKAAEEHKKAREDYWEKGGKEKETMISNSNKFNNLISQYQELKQNNSSNSNDNTN